MRHHRRKSARDFTDLKAHETIVCATSYDGLGHQTDTTSVPHHERRSGNSLSAHAAIRRDLLLHVISACDDTTFGPYRRMRRHC